MSLHLTRDEWERIAAEGGGVLFRPSVRRPGTDSGSWEIAEHPPAEFVEAAKPCETCQGRGWYFIGDPTISESSQTCGRCLDGTRRIAVAVPCDECERQTNHRLHDLMSHWTGAGIKCDGYVTVGHVVVEWGPCLVIHWDDQVRIATMDEFVVVGSPTDPTWAAHYVRGDDIGRRMGRFTLLPDIDPQSLVGQYAIGIKVVEP